MINVEFRITVTRYGNQNTQYESQVKDIFSGFRMEFSVYDRNVQFAPNIIKRKNRNSDHQTYFLSMVGELPFELVGGHVLFCKEDVPGLFDMVDDMIVDALEPAAVGYALALMIAYPILDVRNCLLSILVNGKEWMKKFCSENDLILEASRRHSNIIQAQLSLQQVWNWICNNTDLYKKCDSSPVIFSALTYIFNRTYPEAIFYSIQGLEAELVAPNSRSISKDLQKAISARFPGVSVEDVCGLYKKRSRFAHGDVPLENILITDTSLMIDEDYREDAELSCALILETVRRRIQKSLV